MTGELSIIRTFTGSPVEMRAYPSANKIDDEYSAGITLTRNTDVALLYFNEHGIILRDVVAAQNREVAFTTPPQEFDLALYDGFTVNGRCFYYKTQESVVHVIGGVNGSFPYKLSTTIGQLPAGFRPSAATRGIAVTNNAPAYIQINTNGAVVLYEMGLDGTPAGASAFFVLSFVAAD